MLPANGATRSLLAALLKHAICLSSQRNEARGYRRAVDVSNNYDDSEVEPQGRAAS